MQPDIGEYLNDRGHNSQSEHAARKAEKLFMRRKTWVQRGPQPGSSALRKISAI